MRLVRFYWIGVAVVAAVVAVSRLGGPGKPVAIPPAEPGRSATAPRQVNDNVVAYHTGDDRMNLAKVRGRETLPRFLELMDRKTPGNYVVKFPLTQNGETEHIWLQIDGRRGSTFTGRLANTPVNGSRYKIGDRLSVSQDQVEDWMITSGDLIYGGYTARVAIADLPPERAEAMNKRFRD